MNNLTTSRWLLAAFVLIAALMFSCSDKEAIEFFTEEEKEQMFASWPSGDGGSSSSSNLPEENIFCKIGDNCVEVPLAMCLGTQGMQVPDCGISSSSTVYGSSSSVGEAKDVYCKVGENCSLITEHACSVVEGTIVPDCGVSSSSSVPGSSSSNGSSSSSALKECEDLYNPDTRFCYDGIIYDKCDGIAYNPATHICTGNTATRARCNNIDYNPLTQFCYQNSKVGQICAGNSSYDPDNYECENSILLTRCGSGNDFYNPATEACCSNSKYTQATQYCSNGTVRTYGTLNDTRDGLTYKTVEIGTQIWMAENLNHDADGSRCYGDNTGSDSQNRCDTYGRLYNWAMAMNNSASSTATPSGVQGVCPQGWHLPSDNEWNVMTAAAGGTGTGGRIGAGTILKATSGWNTGSGYIEGKDNHGFSALPGGTRFSGSFSGVGNSGSWWSATQSDVSFAWRRSMGYNDSDVDRFSHDKSNLFSVRCVRD
ncbi:MAG: hypothetical protein FWH22_01585 [Fibromonadales bacterium]|nr:hypothetical protein [Fibromonadales bacterium]